MWVASWERWALERGRLPFHALLAGALRSGLSRAPEGRKRPPQGGPDLFPGALDSPGFGGGRVAEAVGLDRRRWLRLTQHGDSRQPNPTDPTSSGLPLDRSASLVASDRS